MKPIILAILGICFYGLSNVLVEQKLSKIHALTLLVCYLPMIWAIAFTSRYLTTGSEEISLGVPTDRKTWIILLVLSVTLLLGDALYLGAYNYRGQAIVITSLLILMPVATAAFRTIWVREMPNFYHILGYLFAAIAVVLIAKGNVVKP